LQKEDTSYILQSAHNVCGGQTLSECILR